MIDVLLDRKEYMLLKSQQKHLEDILVFHFEYMPRIIEKENENFDKRNLKSIDSHESTEVLEE